LEKRKRLYKVATTLPQLLKNNVSYSYIIIVAKFKIPYCLITVEIM